VPVTKALDFVSKVLSKSNPWVTALRIMLKPTELGKDDVYVLPDGKRNPNVPLPPQSREAMPRPTPPAMPKPPGEHGAPPAPPKPVGKGGSKLSIKDLLPEPVARSGQNAGTRPTTRGEVPDGSDEFAGLRFPSNPGKSRIELEPRPGEKPPVVGSVHLPVGRSGLQLRGAGGLDGSGDNDGLNIDWKAWLELRWPFR
jgi:hypothetical protein